MSDLFAFKNEKYSHARSLYYLEFPYYPAALHTFASWPTLSVCHLIHECPTPQDAKKLSLEDFTQLLKGHGFTRKAQILAAFERLQADYPMANEAVIAAYKPQALALSAMLLTTQRTKIENLALLNRLFEQHPDAAIFASLPGAGDWLAPALLVKFGEDRKRFPEASLLQAVAGASPVTHKSGKHRAIFFRRACDREFRLIVQQWARASCAKSAWASSYFQQTQARLHKENHAYRCLGMTIK